MNILFVNACVRPTSRTYKIAEYFLNKIQENKNVRVKQIDIEKEKLMPLSNEDLIKRDIYSERHDFSDSMFKYAIDFSKADFVVVAAPYWDLSFPASLKLFFEHINVSGLTFKYENGLPKPLCKAEKLVYITTSGGPILSEDYGYGYVKALCNTFYGIEKTVCIKAENLDIIGADVDAIINKTFEKIDNLVCEKSIQEKNIII